MSFIDNIVGYISPKAAFERARWRRATDILQERKFDAASKSRRTTGWASVDTSVNVLTGIALSTLRARSRDLVRNNPYARKAISVIVNNTVGTGIQAAPMSRSANRTETAKTMWRKWAGTTECDWDGQRTFYGIQKAALRTVAESGECIILLRRKRNGTVPIQLQLLEPDYLDSSKDIREMGDGGKIMQGVEYDKSGKRVAYWLYDSHPGEYGFRESRRVDASNVIHLYEVLRPGQVRGIPFGVSAMMRLKDFDDYEDAELVRQKIAACFAAFVVDADPSSAVGSGGSDEMIERLEPGIIEHLPPGKQIEFASPPTTGNYDNYSRKILQAIASGYGITYESLTGDLSNVNFSSGRMGWLEMQRQIESWQWDMMVPMMCQPVWSWFTDAAAIMGLSTGDLSVEWTAPRREMIDPVKETNAIVTQIRAGIRSWPEAIREQGYEPDQVLTEIAEFNTKVDSKGIILDTDPRKTKAEQLKAEPEAPQNQNQE
jgi:lambda family phage portal protein